MNADHSDDLVLGRLQRLATLEPDASRSHAVRARCHALLARQRRKGGSRPRSTVVVGIESLLIGALGLSYLVAVMVDLLRVHPYR